MEEKLIDKYLVRYDKTQIERLKQKEIAEREHDLCIRKASIAIFLGIIYFTPVIMVIGMLIETLSDSVYLSDLILPFTSIFTAILFVVCLIIATKGPNQNPMSEDTLNKIKIVNHIKDIVEVKIIKEYGMCEFYIEKEGEIIIIKHRVEIVRRTDITISVIDLVDDRLFLVFNELGKSRNKNLD